MSTELRAGITCKDAIRNYINKINNINDTADTADINDANTMDRINSDYILLINRLEKSLARKRERLIKKMDQGQTYPGGNQVLKDIYKTLLLYYYFLDGWTIKISKYGKISARKKFND